MLTVVASDRQSDEALYREFSRYIRNSGVPKTARRLRYREPSKSRNERRRAAQQKRQLREEYEYNLKIGRIRPTF